MNDLALEATPVGLLCKLFPSRKITTGPINVDIWEHRTGNFENNRKKESQHTPLCLPETAVLYLSNP